ncbi:hypothetical protein XENOCAPTIV_016957 [Xenoophorus captivus]|uniref:Secreted protein n=1 Tax=Xenoophorus captivus TaxID=1517983 RepID=A0ABV0QDJ3_9TELE
MMLPLAPVVTAIAPVVSALIVALLVAAWRLSSASEVLLVRRLLTLEGPIPAVAPRGAPASVLLRLPVDTSVQFPVKPGTLFPMQLEAEDSPRKLGWDAAEGGRRSRHGVLPGICREQRTGSGVNLFLVACPATAAYEHCRWTYEVRLLPTGGADGSNRA